MDSQQSLIDQLEGVVASEDLSRRAEMLRRVTDLFIVGSGKFSGEQIELFDGVMGRLVENIELTARAAFANRLAGVADAPAKVIRALAFDDAIEVAAPVLAQSSRLDDLVLAENARTRSQGHLLAITERSILSEPVTDVLIDRGNHQVAAATVGNRGARFSASGMATLVKRAQDNSDLALRIWSRPDTARRDLVRLFAQASEIVRRRLEVADPQQAALIRSAVAEASEEIQAEVRTDSSEYAEALVHVRTLHGLGQLDEARLLGFAHEGHFDRTAVALSILCNLPIGLVERALVRDEPDQVLVLGKAIGLTWETTKALLALQAGGGRAKEKLDQCFATFFRLQPKTARTALQFFRLREKAEGAPAR